MWTHAGACLSIIFKPKKRSKSDTSNCFHFVSFLPLYSWENPKLHPLFPPIPCPLLTMSTHTHTHRQNTHSLECTDERLSTNDKVPRPLNTSKIELLVVVVVGGWGGLLALNTRMRAHTVLHLPIHNTISRGLNQTRRVLIHPNVHLHLSPCIASLPTQTQQRENTGEHGGT